ncbi:U6 snRNA phosphodiesterase Usb1 [Kockiozyma suomiensis]|uniref:U6 snRNA phosphodiesterase Usb1 n=1 Tax=Kockiozyma suomiensis TaxID=1337062 RepID=UPI003343FA43
MADKSPPPLPMRFLDLYPSAPRIGDDPELHGGRERSSPHEAGKWPTHVYVEWLPTPAEALTLKAMLPSDATSLLHSQFGAQLPLHVSLSPPLKVTTDDREPFIEAIWSAIDSISSFSVEFTGLQWLSNPSYTRDFLALTVGPSAELEELFQATQSVCKSMSYETFTHDRPQPHVSVAWRLPAKSANELPASEATIARLRADIDTVKIKIGRLVYRKSL